MYMRPQRVVTTSNAPASRPSADSASSTRSSSPVPAPASRANASISADTSVPSTRPVGPTRRAARTAGSPRPVARSSTCIPGPTPARSSMRSLSGAVRRASIASYFFHTSTTPSPRIRARLHERGAAFTAISGARAPRQRRRSPPRAPGKAASGRRSAQRAGQPRPLPVRGRRRGPRPAPPRP